MICFILNYCHFLLFFSFLISLKLWCGKTGRANIDIFSFISGLYSIFNVYGVSFFSNYYLIEKNNVIHENFGNFLVVEIIKPSYIHILTVYDIVFAIYFVISVRLYRWISKTYYHGHLIRNFDHFLPFIYSRLAHNALLFFCNK